MLPYKKVLAALNLTQLDKNVVSYCGLLSKLSASREVKFLFANRPSNYPMMNDTIGQASVSEFTTRVMKDQINRDFKGYKGSMINYDVLDGEPLEQILQTVVTDNTELLVVGRKRSALDTRRVPVKLARTAPCSVMIVPENAEIAISRIMVPIDFSTNAGAALKLAVDMAHELGCKRIYGVHIYFLPLGYSKSGKTGIEYAKMMKKRAIQQFEQFVEEFDLKGIEIKMDYMISRRPAKMIRKAIRKRGCDFVVAGAKGQSGLGCLGSVTENLMLTAKCPMITVKAKGEGLEVLNELMSKSSFNNKLKEEVH